MAASGSSQLLLAARGCSRLLLAATGCSSAFGCTDIADMLLATLRLLSRIGLLGSLSWVTSLSCFALALLLLSVRGLALESLSTKGLIESGKSLK